MKTVDESRSVLSEVMLPGQANPSGTVHGGEIMKLLHSLHERGITVILVTHDPEIGRHARRRIVVRDGVVIKDEED